jgi:hypothetical protein
MTRDADTRCSCCPQSFTILIGASLLCVSPHPALPQGVSATVGVEPPSPSVPTTSAVALNFDDEVSALEAAWLLQPGARELIRKNASTSRAFAASAISSAENSKSAP